MLRSKSVYLAVSLGMALAAAAPVRAQSLVMSLPRPSQRAVATQRIGLTDITITYHRPLAGDRKIWGELVPYDKVWRAGANENTTIEFTDPVSIEGQPLARGIYGLHMIPGAEKWTVIFSKNYTSWGSFSYDQKEDALRVTVKPQAAELHDALTYDFDGVKPDSTLVTLKWEKVAVPIRVSVGDETTVQNIRNQLRNLAQYSWEGWNDAALQCATSRINLDEALLWADKSIQLEERFENLTTRMSVLEELKRPAEAAAARTRAMAMGTPTQIYFFGRQLQAQKRQDEALEIFRVTAKRFPEHWLGHLALARVDSAAGDFSNATREIKAAQAAGVAEPQKQRVEDMLRLLEAGKDINN